ncbi:hypothetical protein BGZ98_008132 [Dissophora globulifera]|nr:hypothetical protein BGZ98_008132 [Dissophora globulifera]
MAYLRTAPSVDAFNPTQHIHHHRRMPSQPEFQAKPEHHRAGLDRSRNSLAVIPSRHSSASPSPSLSHADLAVHDMSSISNARRSMSPINGAAFAMKNFLLRRRGGTVSNSAITKNNKYIIHADNGMPHNPALSFVFVGGYGVVPGTTTVVYDSEIAVSEANTPTVANFQSSVFVSANSNDSTESLQDFPMAAEKEMTTVVAPSFSQAALTAAFNRRRSSAVSFSSDSSILSIPTRSRHASLTSDARSSSTAASSTSTLGATLVHKPLPSTTASQVEDGRRNDNEEGEELTISIVRFKRHTVFHARDIVDGDEKDLLDAISNSAPAVAPLEAQEEDSEAVKVESPQEDIDLWSGTICGDLSWSLDSTDLPADSFKLQFSLDDVKHVVEEHEQEQQPNQVQQDDQHISQQRKLIHQNSLNFHHLRGKMTAHKSNSADKSKTSGLLNGPLRLRRLQSESGLLTKFQEPSPSSSTPDAIRESNKAVQDTEEILVLRSKDILIPQSNRIEAAVSGHHQGLHRSVSTSSVTKGNLIISNNSSPTQFYDAPQIRYALRTFMATGENSFDEMVEHGFPAKAITNTRNEIVNRTSPASSDCRYQTLRITLTPWHARADEQKLYGLISSTEFTPVSGRQASSSMRAMVNKLFSRSGAASPAAASVPTTTTITTPPSSQTAARPSAASRTKSDQSMTSVMGTERETLDRSFSDSRVPKRVTAARHIRLDSINRERTTSPLAAAAVIESRTGMVSPPATRSPTPTSGSALPIRKSSLLLEAPAHASTRHRISGSMSSTSSPRDSLTRMGRPREKDYTTYTKQSQAEETLLETPQPSSSSLFQQSRRDSRFPHQQLQALRASLAAASMAPPHPALPMRTSSACAMATTTDAEERSVPRQGNKLFHESARDNAQEPQQEIQEQEQKEEVKVSRRLSQSPPPPVMPPPPPPRLNAKSLRRKEATAFLKLRQQQQQFQQQMILQQELYHEFSTVVDPAAATASLAEIARQRKSHLSILCPPYEFHGDEEEAEEEAEEEEEEEQEAQESGRRRGAVSYFASCMDERTGRVNTSEEEEDEEEYQQFHNRQASEAAARAGACWRPIQCRQTPAMRAYAFP